MHNPDDTMYTGHHKQNIKSLAQFMGFWTIRPLNYLRVITSRFPPLNIYLLYCSALQHYFPVHSALFVTCFSRTCCSSSSAGALSLLLSARPSLLIVSCSSVRCNIVWPNSFKWHYSRGIACTLQSDSATTKRLLYAHTQLNKTFQKMALLIFSIVAE